MDTGHLAADVSMVRKTTHNGGSIISMKRGHAMKRFISGLCLFAMLIGTD
ncbi:hypothetical protein OYT1_ch0893 [Ferriphaselus amnicola]|uniref:Uncharacterized protein n=1 Tax=Ferriphaselus amnicola TaxID=1188319 RepID=A0A2Z6GAG7_9PROT|nr:hypothetical protein OYT1_ch0893 [Ferriphaselus amnicola]